MSNRDYLIWDNLTLQNFSPETITKKYNQGYVLVRTGKGNMIQTRSLRINLEGFEFNSENRRVLRKVDDLKAEATPLPITLENYSWKIHKMGKDFFTTKFGKGTFSANKIKTLITEKPQSNFNLLLRYTKQTETIGYAICYQNKDIFHYAYPFYDLKMEKSNYGMGMMLKAIEHSLDSGNNYFYLGSVSKPADRYKLQFNNLEWFDGAGWKSGLAQLKEIIKKD